jgi:hypothetical protein
MQRSHPTHPPYNPAGEFVPASALDNSYDVSARELVADLYRRGVPITVNVINGNQINNAASNENSSSKFEELFTVVKNIGTKLEKQRCGSRAQRCGT